jgi:NADH:ubiquinone oxidoreductase subunit 6 (subunit J)
MEHPMGEILIYALPILTAVVAAIQAIRSQSLLRSALWLAGVSASLAVLFYMLGAGQVAVIELSVGAGLVTVLFVFAIGIAGAEIKKQRPIVPKMLAWVLILVPVLLLAGFALPFASTVQPSHEPETMSVFWQQRGLDVVVQVVLIFCGVLGLLGVLAEEKAPLEQPMVEEIAAERERDLRNLERQSSRSMISSQQGKAR